jgi:hypothetical protein
MNRRKFIRNISVATSTMIVGGSLANELVGNFSNPRGFLNDINAVNSTSELRPGIDHEEFTLVLKEENFVDYIYLEKRVKQ